MNGANTSNRQGWHPPLAVLEASGVLWSTQVFSHPYLFTGPGLVTTKFPHWTYHAFISAIHVSFVPCSILPDLKHNKPNQLLGNAAIKDVIWWKISIFWHRAWYLIITRGVGCGLHREEDKRRISIFLIGICIPVLLETMQIFTGPGLVTIKCPHWSYWVL